MKLCDSRYDKNDQEKTAKFIKNTRICRLVGRGKKSYGNVFFVGFVRQADYLHSHLRTYVPVLP